MSGLRPEVPSLPAQPRACRNLGHRATEVDADVADADFEAFYRSAHPRVVRSLALAIGSVDAASDAAQEAFERAYRRWRDVQRADRPETWVYVVAMRHHLRSHRRRGVAAEIVLPPTALPDVDRAVAVDRALAALTARQREMVVLRFHADLPVKDIAQAMGCAEGTVKATLHQALRLLRIEFDDEDLS
jgi:RNA polymerase sigma-70 factor (ECF subfamily)